MEGDQFVIYDENFDHLIDLFAGEAIEASPIGDRDMFPAAPAVELFDVDFSPCYGAGICPVFGSLRSDGVEFVNWREDESGTTVEEESSVTTGAVGSGGTPPKKKCSKGDRSRTLISERRRRGRMKEKLFALRSLVPYISKMDKASIVGDSVLYLQDLQMQAKNLKAEIAGLNSSSLVQGEKCRHTSFQNDNMKKPPCFNSITNKIFEMDVMQIDKKGYYARIVSSQEIGMATILHKALDSLTDFHIQSSQLTVSQENYLLTFTFHMVDDEMEVTLPDLRVGIASMLLKEGFVLEKYHFDSSSFMTCCSCNLAK